MFDMSCHWIFGQLLFSFITQNELKCNICEYKKLTNRQLDGPVRTQKHEQQQTRNTVNL